MSPDAWRKTSVATRLAIAVACLLCTLPPATNFGPGQGGYVLALVVLVPVTLWALHEGGGPAALSRREAWALAALGGWLAISVLRAGPMWDTALAATLLAVLAAAAPWALSRVRTATESAAQVIALVMAAAVVGSAVAAWIVPLVLLQGIAWRPGLPIGGASNNAVGLVLALAATLAGARIWPRQRWVWRALALVAGLLIVQSLSRAAWLLALVVLVVALVSHRRWDLRRGLPVGGLLAAGAVTELVRRRGANVLLDPARWDNAVTGVDAWSGSLGTVLFGLGPMRLWPWMALERGRPGEELRGMQHESPWGAVLYHAHSTYLEVLVEYGIVGLVLLLVVLGVVVRRCVREIRQRGDLMLVAVALLLALPAMLVELYLLRGFPSAFLFWAAVMAVGRGQGSGGSKGSGSWESGEARAPLLSRPWVVKH